MTLRVVLVLTLMSVSPSYPQTSMTPDAQYDLGTTYYWGQGVPQDYAQAAAWFRKAADRGYAPAQFGLGLLYRDGQGMPQDYRQAAVWFRKAADQGVANSQFTLGAMYRDGHGVPQDYLQAAAWFGKAADQGFSPAQFNLGLLYRDGQGVAQDNVQAAAWFRTAADHGDTDAQFQLGRMYENGQGVMRDYVEAAHWYRKAADQGDPLGMIGLGGLYISGKGVPQDYVEGTKYERMAAETGNPLGQLMLGLGYANGDGVPQDFVQAYMWLNLAAAGGLGSLAKENRDAVLRTMSREQIAQAQEMARTWKPTETGTRDEHSSSIAGTLPRLEATGTGFFVTGQGHIVTNYHVIIGCTALKVQTGILNVIARDEGNDLALLKSIQSASQFATFSVGPVRVGQSVMAVGYPLRGLLSSGANVTMGNVSALAGPNDDTGLLQITAPVQPGNSGGPLLDQSGSVIGVVVSKLDTLKIARATGDIPQNVNFAIKGAVVRSFLEANGVEFSTAASTAKLDPTVIAERATKSTVVVECWK